MCISTCTSTERTGTFICCCMVVAGPCELEAEAAAEWWKHLSRECLCLTTKWASAAIRQGAVVLWLPAAVNQHLSACWSSQLWISNEKWSWREDLRSKNKDWDEDSRREKPCFHRSALQDISSIIFMSSSLYFLRKEMLGVCLLHLSQLTNFNYILQETNTFETLPTISLPRLKKLSS